VTVEQIESIDIAEIGSKMNGQTAIMCSRVDISFEIEQFPDTINMITDQVQMQRSETLGKRGFSMMELLQLFLYLIIDTVRIGMSVEEKCQNFD
jgi:hypothetical protein